MGDDDGHFASSDGGDTCPAICGASVDSMRDMLYYHVSLCVGDDCKKVPEALVQHQQWF